MDNGNAPKGGGRLPKQIFYIIGNEACERFSFYGMRNILTQFLVSSAILATLVESDREIVAKEIFHVFVMGVYFFPLLGGWLSDRLWGKYRTILWLSLVYCIGNAFLAFFVVNKAGFYMGLFLISLGSGGIKPCVSAFVGEQFDQSNKHLAKLVFDAFYWIINFGSFFASLFIPLALHAWGPRIAFGIPGFLMFIATVVFWFGRARYIVEPPTPSDPNSFGQICWTILSSSKSSMAIFYSGIIVSLGSLSLYFFTDAVSFVAALCLALVLFGVFTGFDVWRYVEAARGKHPDDDVDGMRAVLRVLVLFAFVTPFWSLFDQKASTWVLQGTEMVLPDWSWFQSASQMQALNPLLVMIFIPFNNVVLFPLLRKAGLNVTQLRKMTLGIGFAGLSWILIGLYQIRIDAGESLSVLVQAWPYLVLTFGEVLVSATGLEFAYSQAPPKMKSVIMSVWTLSVTIGSLWVLLANSTVKSHAVTQAIANAGLGVTAFQMFFFAGFAMVSAAAFGFYASRYTVKDHYRKG